MRWYDVFAHTYDAQLEALYRPYRPAAFDALRLAPGQIVLDLACGTGQNFDGLAERLGPAGRVVGLDASEGMLKKARARADRLGLEAALVHADATAAAYPPVDAVLATLAFTALPDPDAAFAHALDALRPGGRFVLLDVHAERRRFQTWLVEKIARADLNRRPWTLLEAALDDVSRTDLNAPAKTFGGTLYVAAGTKRAL